MMRIAQVASLFERIPPRFAGGSERVVSYLTEELVRQGHEVTLFASGDSKTAATLIAGCPQALNSMRGCRDQIAHHVLLVEKVFRHASSFDIIHNNTEYFPYSVARHHSTPIVTTMHWSMDYMKEDWGPLYSEFSDMPVVSISDAQREPFPSLNWQGTVYHGLPDCLFEFHKEPGKYLAFLGRLSPEKGVRAAIEIAVRAGMELRIGGNIHQLDYFKQIEPLFKHPLINYVGEVSQEEKGDFLGNAYAFLFPIDVKEAFGLVMAEAMACGTPVIARDRGSVREVVADGLTGFIIETVDEAIEAVKKIPTLSRERCRQAFEQRFSASRMARDYVAIYERLVQQAS
jgi:glycosyltransferase involved in cell wall biosynthesis